MNRKFLTDIKKLKEAIAANKLVIFAGAGISIDAGVPSWSTLIEEIKAEIDLPEKETDYLRIAQIYFNERQQKEFVEKVRTVLKHKKVNHNEIHEAVLDLSPEHILTTNFDDLLEQAIEKKSLPFSIIKRDKDFPYATTSNLLVKIHGDLDDVDIILKEDDYLNYSLTHPLTESFIKSVFATKVVLFIGYSFSDVNLKIIMQSVREILGKDFQNAYFLDTNKIFHSSQQEYLNYKGINVISYDEDYIINFLNGDNELLKAYYKKGKSLSTDEGQRLFNFLTFIKYYNSFNERIRPLNIIDQMYLSLNRFSELRVLPPEFIANLFPFNLSQEYIYNYELGSLTTNNKDIYNLFEKYIKIEKDIVKYNPPIELGLKEHEISNLEKRLKAVIEFMNYSFINAIDKEKDKSDSLGYKGSAGQKLKVFIPNNENCNCLNCLWKNLKFSDLINKIENTHITATSKINEDLLLAYSYYQIGEFYKSYLLFDEVAGKAWKEGKYLSYFIAKHNIKGLRNLLYSFNGKVFADSKKIIISEMDDIDLDKLLFQIKSLDELEYQLLQDIRDESNLKSAEKELERLLGKTIEIYEQYNKGGYIIPPSISARKISFELEKVIFFYTYNYIIADKFVDFKDLCNKGLEGLVVLYAVNTKYPYRLKSFNKIFFNVFVFYGDINSLKAIFKRYKVESIFFKEKYEAEMIQLIINFFKSSYSTTVFNEVKPVTFVNNLYFNFKFNDIAIRILFILSKTRFKFNVPSEFIKELKNFLQVDNILNSIYINYLGSFIAINKHIFSLDDYDFLLKLSFRKEEFYENTDYLNSIIYALHKQFPEYLINDNDLMENIFSKIDSKDNIEYILSLWKISNEENKSKIKNKVLSKLRLKFDSDLYYNASINEIISNEEFF